MLRISYRNLDTNLPSKFWIEDLDLFYNDIKLKSPGIKNFSWQKSTDVNGQRRVESDSDRI